LVVKFGVCALPLLLHPCSPVEMLGMTDKDKLNGKSGSKRPTLDQNVQAHIGRKLKAVYEEVATAPIPDRLVQLLAKLEESQRK
jgi:anti-sigma factor NepR-like protein